MNDNAQNPSSHIPPQPETMSGTAGLDVADKVTATAAQIGAAVAAQNAEAATANPTVTPVDGASLASAVQTQDGAAPAHDLAGDARDVEHDVEREVKGVTHSILSRALDALGKAEHFTEEELHKFAAFVVVEFKKIA